MPHWEDELRALLASLQVSLDDDAMPPSMVDLPSLAIEAGGGKQRPGNDGVFEEDQFSIVNREMEATVSEVARLVRSGLGDAALRDDVVRVLRALTRRPPGSMADSQEWQLTSAAAVLHFCRIVLRLARAISHPE